MDSIRSILELLRSHSIFLLMLFFFGTGIFLANCVSNKLKNFKSGELNIRFSIFCLSLLFFEVLFFVIAIIAGLVSEPGKYTFGLILLLFVIGIILIIRGITIKAEKFSLEVNTTSKDEKITQEINSQNNETDKFGDDTEPIKDNPESSQEKAGNAKPIYQKKRLTREQYENIEKFCIEKFMKNRCIDKNDFKCWVRIQQTRYIYDGYYRRNNIDHFVEIKRISPSIKSSYIIKRLLSDLIPDVENPVDLTLLLFVFPEDKNIESILEIIRDAFESQIKSGLLILEPIIPTQEEFDKIMGKKQGNKE